MEKRLGKGLDALIPAGSSKPKEKVERIRLTDIVPNKLQPRKKFATEKMEELLSSVREKGVIQPILVRPKDEGYELIAGERRWRAAQELNHEDIPAIIKNDISDVDSLEISIIENIQRDDLNPIDLRRNEVLTHVVAVVAVIEGGGPAAAGLRIHAPGLGLR